MSLFNAMSINNLLYNNLKIVNSLQHFNKVPDHGVQFKQLKYNDHITANNLDTLLIKANQSASLNLSHSSNSLTNRTLISPSFFAGLIHKYWQETIFISKSNLLSEKYINQLKSNGISIYYIQYKKFLFDFSQALMKGRITTYLNSNTNAEIVNNDPSDIKYTWRKGLNLFFQNKKLLSSLHSRQNRNLNKIQINLIKKLKDNRLPVFTVTNGSNQIVIAEPADELMYNNNFFDTIYQWYYNNVLNQNDTRPSYEGLFFINSADALEYKQYIKRQYIGYNIYDQSSNLNIVPSSLDVYYKLVNTSHMRVKFYLIPDLKELGELIYKYQYYKNIIFHNKQKYGKYYFQGQPIYIIQPIYCRDKISKQMHLVKYFYELNYNARNKNYDTIFMSYKVALLAWQKFIDNHQNYNLPKNPKIVIYNLEDFLNSYQNDMSLHKTNLLFVPNQESYKFIKATKKTRNNNVLQSFAHQLLYCKIIAKRLIWSFTSRQPMTW